MWWVVFSDDPNFYHGPFKTNRDAEEFGSDETQYEGEHGYFDLTFSVVESDGSPIVH